jgi:hypothetical protein
MNMNDQHRNPPSIAGDDRIAALQEIAALGNPYVVGSLVKFKRGRYEKGIEKEIVPLGTRFAAEPDIKLAYIEFSEDEDGQTVVGAPIPWTGDRNQRESLGRTDQEKWETNSDGSKIDPIPLTAYLVVHNLRTGESMTISMMSKSALKVMFALAGTFANYLRASPKSYPIIEVGSTTVTFKKGGKNIEFDKPTLRIVEWRDPDKPRPAPAEAADGRPRGKMTVETGKRDYASRGDEPPPIESYDGPNDSLDVVDFG